MKYCNNCQCLTRGNPLYCESCGRTYEVKLCPHRHENPRTARVCSQCGSTDLSTPHPTLPLWLSPLLYFITLLPGVLLLLLSVLLLTTLVQALLTNQQLLQSTFIAGLLIAILWWLYLQIPGGLRKAFGSGGHKSKDKDHGHS